MVLTAASSLRISTCNNCMKFWYIKTTFSALLKPAFFNFAAWHLHFLPQGNYHVSTIYHLNHHSAAITRCWGCCRFHRQRHLFRFPDSSGMARFGTGALGFATGFSGFVLLAGTLPSSLCCGWFWLSFIGLTGTLVVPTSSSFIDAHPVFVFLQCFSIVSSISL